MPGEALSQRDLRFAFYVSRSTLHSLMSFLAPLFLFGALAVAAPIIFHLIRRTSREKMTFSSLMFLQPTPPRMTRQSRLEHILLLLLRCLVLCLLALGFARPFLQKPVAADTAKGEGKRLVVLVDASASMRRDALWSEALSRAERILKEAGPSDVAAVLVFDRVARPVVNFEQWSAMAVGDRPVLTRQRLAEFKPGWASTHLGHALAHALEMLEDRSGRDQPATAAGTRRIVVVSDLQEGARLDGLQGLEWPRGVEVVIDQLKAKRPTNAGLHSILDHDDVDRAAVDSEIKVRVSNVSTSSREQFQIGWRRPGEKTFAGTPADAYVPPGQSRVVTAPKPPTGLAPEQLLLTGDDDEFDNAAFLVAPEPEEVSIFFLGGDPQDDPKQVLYFLQRAFQETRRQALRVVVRPGGAPLLPNDGKAPPLFIVSDPLVKEQAERLKGMVTAGKTALIVIKNAAATETVSQLLGIEGIRAEEAPADRYALLSQIDFQHPLFAPFADPRYSDFTKIHFWRHRRLEMDKLLGARVLAQFDDGSPALVQVPLGRGSVLVLTSGWHPADSQLALSSKFVPLLYAMVELSGDVKPPAAQMLVGDTVSLAPTNTAAQFTVRKPDGTQAKLTVEGRFLETDLLGIYTAFSPRTTNRFAVNLDPSESRTAPLPLEELERLGLPLKAPTLAAIKQAQERKARLQAAELEQRQKLWRWLLVTALVILVMETALAGWITRRGSAQPASQ
jgi:hypothetical protein